MFFFACRVMNSLYYYKNIGVYYIFQNINMYPATSTFCNSVAFQRYSKLTS